MLGNQHAMLKFSACKQNVENGEKIANLGDLGINNDRVGCYWKHTVFIATVRIPEM